MTGKTLAEVFGIVPPVAPPDHLSPVRRTGRLLLLLRSPRTLDELQALLGTSGAQLRRDLKELREEGWPIEESAGRGRTPKHLWLALAVPPAA